MKAIVFALAVLFASVSAVPQALNEKDLEQERFIDAILESLLQDLINNIQVSGLDPYHLEYAEGSWALPVPTILSVWGYGQNVQLIGLSNIIINSISYGVLTGRLQADLSMPQLYGSVGSAGGSVNVFGNLISGQGNGEITVSGIRGTVDARISISVLGGVSVTSLDFVGSIESISADITAVIGDYDLSPYFNAVLNEYLLKYLNEFSAEINELISYYALIIINDRL